MPRNLRTLARGQECMVRMPFVCNHDPETTVLAHIRRGHVAGVGQKPPDLCGVWACSACHDAIDKRAHMYNQYDLDGLILEALCRQLAWYSEKEIITVCL